MNPYHVLVLVWSVSAFDLSIYRLYPKTPKYSQSLLSKHHQTIFISSSRISLLQGSHLAASSTTSDILEEPIKVEFPPPLSTVDRFKRAAKFWSSAVPIVLSYYSLYAEMKLKESLLGTSMSQDEAEVRVHEESIHI